MKRVIGVLAVLMLAIAVSTPAFAQQAQSPKGTEGPDVRKQEPKGTEGPAVRKGGNKTQPDGPDIRKTKRSPRASTKQKGAEGPDTRQKADPKATVDAGGRKSEEKKAQ